MVYFKFECRIFDSNIAILVAFMFINELFFEHISMTVHFNKYLEQILDCLLKNEKNKVHKRSPINH